MCVETLRTVLISPRRSIWGVTCLGLLKKWTFSPLSPEKPHKCVLKPSEQGSFFQNDWFEGSYCLSLLWKMNVFPLYVFRNIINVCRNPQNSACFSKMIDLRGHIPRLTQKMNIFTSINWNLINVCWNPQNRAHFSKMIDLRGHMPRFTLKMNVFPSISWETP